MTTAETPERTPMDRPGVVRALPGAEDPLVIEARDVLLGASTLGFVSVVIIGMRPRNAGVSVIGSMGLDVMKTLGALELAKADLVLQMRMGQRVPPPMPPGGGDPERKL